MVDRNCTDMSDVLKEVRVPITGLFALLLVTGVVLFQRRQVAKATGEVETLVIAKFLTELPRDAVTFLGSKQSCGYT